MIEEEDEVLELILTHMYTSDCMPKIENTGTKCHNRGMNKYHNLRCLENQNIVS